MTPSTGAGVQLTDWLRRHGTRKCEFAHRLGITRAFLSQLLHGHRRANLETLGKIEELTGIPIKAWMDMSVSDMENQKKVSRITAKLTTR